MKIEELFVGQFVHFQGRNKKDNGRVKSMTEHGVFVVYNCASDWDHYEDYTGANTNPDDLREGWATKKETEFIPSPLNLK